MQPVATSRSGLVLIFVAAALATAGAPCRNAMAAAPVEAVRPRPAEAAHDIRLAVRRSISLIEASAAEYRRQRQCFSCHHQGLPVVTLVEARNFGFEVDEASLTAQLEHTAAHLDRGRAGYSEGRGQGGGVDTAGWALWALEVGGYQPNETTAATAGYLLSHQADLGRWRSTGTNRPPTQGSEFTATYLALRGLETFGSSDRSEAIAARRTRALEWLLASKPSDTEDRVFRLRSLSYLDADSEEIAEAARALLVAQRPDGGWSQTADLPSDAYATGTALVALHEAGSLATSDPAYVRGVAYLLDSALPDGSWHVATRAKPVQIYFESGFPHGRDQFVSMAATCWATLALLPACPMPEAR